MPDVGIKRRQIGGLSLCASLLTVDWNALYVGPFQLTIIFLAVALTSLVTLASGTLNSFRYPISCLSGAIIIAASGLLSEVFPPSPGYLQDQLNDGSQGFFRDLSQFGGNLPNLLKFEVSLLILPLAMIMYRPTRREIRRLADCYAISAAISAFVAMTDAFRLTNISNSILIAQQADSNAYIFARPPGLTSQPNHLAFTVALALPVVLTWFTRGARGSVAAVAVLGALGTGLYEAASRGGFVGAVVAIILVMLTTARLRKILYGLTTILLSLALLDTARAVRVVSSVAHAQRLNDISNGASDISRAAARATAINDFRYRPIFGIGYQYLGEGHQVELELLAAGGLMAFVGYFIYQAGVLASAKHARLVDAALGIALTVDVVTVFIIGLVENQVADLYLFVPAALIIALGSASTYEGEGLPRSEDRGQGSQVVRVLPNQQCNIVSASSGVNPPRTPSTTLTVRSA